jgi:DNA-binding MarR family transcriptional regulator
VKAKELFVKNSYIRFLNIIAAPDSSNPRGALDEKEIQLLEFTLRSFERGESLLVGDLLKLSQFGSQATLHSRIKNLAALGYVNLISDKEDGRKKWVILTKTALKYVKFMSECLGNAVAS